MVVRPAVADHQEPPLGDHPIQLEPPAGVARSIDRGRADDDDVHALVEKIAGDLLAFGLAVAVVVAGRDRGILVARWLGDDAVNALRAAVHDTAHPVAPGGLEHVPGAIDLDRPDTRHPAPGDRRTAMRGGRPLPDQPSPDPHQRERSRSRRSWWHRVSEAPRRTVPSCDRAWSPNARAPAADGRDGIPRNPCRR